MITIAMQLEPYICFKFNSVQKEINRYVVLHEIWVIFNDIVILHNIMLISLLSFDSKLSIFGF